MPENQAWPLASSADSPAHVPGPTWALGPLLSGCSRRVSPRMSAFLALGA